MKKTILSIIAIIGFSITTMAQVTATISSGGPTTFCTGSNVKLSSTIVPASVYQYQWIKDGVNITGANASSYTATITGTYVLKATALNSLVYNSNAITVTVTVNSTPIIADVSLIICSNSPFILTPKDGGVNLTDIVPTGTTYSWPAPSFIGGLTGGVAANNQPNISGILINPTNTVQTTTYTVTPSANGCPGTPFIVTVTVNPKPIIPNQTAITFSHLVNGVILGNNINTPLATVYNITSINSNGLPAYAGNPQLGNGFLNDVIADDAWTNITPSAVNVFYTVVPISAVGCEGNPFNVTLTINPQINVLITTTPITCYGANNASITLTVTGGAPPYTVQWNNLDAGFYQNNLAAATYVILITDSLMFTKTVTVAIPEAPIFTIYPIVKNISCYGANDGSINLNLVGGKPPLTLTWSDASTAGLIRNNLGPEVYTATISDGTRCYITRRFTIVEPQLLVLDKDITNVEIWNNPNSGSINLKVSGGTPPFKYDWSNGIKTEDLNNISAGNYLVTVTDSNGCSKQAQYSVNALPTITGTLVICAQGTSQLTSSTTAAANTAWVSSNPLVAKISNTGLVTGVSVGTTIITYTNSNGYQITAIVTVNPVPSVILTPINNYIDVNSSPIQLNGTPNGGIYSGLGVVGSIFYPATAGLGNKTITYNYTNNSGCSNFANQSIIVYDIIGSTCSTLTISMPILGLTSQNNINTITVYPNPTRTNITIDFGNFIIMNGYTVKINNSLGQQVYTGSINQQSSNIDVTTLSGAGIYYLSIKDPQSNTVAVRKIVLQ